MRVAVAGRRSLAKTDMPHAEIPRSDSYAYERVSRDALGQRIAALLATSPVPIDLLRDAVCDFVRTRQGIGEQPDRVLAQVKAVAVRALTAQEHRADATAIVEQVVRWCIEEMFRPAQAGPVEMREPERPGSDV